MFPALRLSLLNRGPHSYCQPGWPSSLLLDEDWVQSSPLRQDWTYKTLPGGAPACEGQKCGSRRRQGELSDGGAGLTPAKGRKEGKRTGRQGPPRSWGKSRLHPWGSQQRLSDVGIPHKAAPCLTTSSPKGAQPGCGPQGRGTAAGQQSTPAGLLAGALSETPVATPPSLQASRGRSPLQAPPDLP